jgi:hypothetical protein
LCSPNSWEIISTKKQFFKDDLMIIHYVRYSI